MLNCPTVRAMYCTVSHSLCSPLGASTLVGLLGCQLPFSFFSSSESSSVPQGWPEFRVRYRTYRTLGVKVNPHTVERVVLRVMASGQQQQQQPTFTCLPGGFWSSCRHTWHWLRAPPQYEVAGCTWPDARCGMVHPSWSAIKKTSHKDERDSDILYTITGNDRKKYQSHLTTFCIKSREMIPKVPSHTTTFCIQSREMIAKITRVTQLHSV